MLILATLFETEQRQYQWQNDLTLPAGNLMLALERDEQRVTSTTDYTDTGRNIDSMLAGYRIDRGPHDLQINLRSDRDNQFGTHVTGSADYGYRLSPAWRVTAGIGSAFKAPTFNDLYWPLQYGYQGNPDLKPEKSVSDEIGLHYDAGRARLSPLGGRLVSEGLLGALLGRPRGRFILEGLRDFRRGVTGKMPES